MKISINKIRPNPYQERKTFEDIVSLSDQMKKNGFWGSLLAREKGSNYEIAFGERRIQAARKAGIKEVEIEVRDMDDKEMMVLTTVENTYRMDVPPLERAEHVEKVQKATGWTERELGKNLWLDQATINRYLALMRAHQDVKKLVAEDKIGWTAAVEAEEAGGPELVRTVIREKLTKDEVRDIKKAIEFAPDRKRELVRGEVYPIDLERERLKHDRKSSPNDKAHEIIKAIDLCTMRVEYLSEIFHKLSPIYRKMAVTALRDHDHAWSELKRKGSFLDPIELEGNKKVETAKLK